MVLTTPKVLTHGIELVLQNHTRTRGPSVTHMWDFWFKERGVSTKSKKLDTLLGIFNMLEYLGEKGRFKKCL